MFTPNQMTLSLWLNYWQRRLFLRDWTVHLKLVREADVPMEARGGVGWCTPCIQNKVATIDLLHPLDYKKEWRCDLELTLVHELLHVHYAPFEYKDLHTLEGIGQEQSINAISLALVNMKRGIN